MSAGEVCLNLDTSGMLGVEKIAEATHWQEAELLPGGRLVLGDAMLTAEGITLDAGLCVAIMAGNFSEAFEVYLNNEDIKHPLTVRRWQPGDAYRPLGSPGTRKLQDCFVDRSIPAAQRSELPVVCDRENTILWVPGMPPAEICRITQSTASALRLTYCKI